MKILHIITALPVGGAQTVLKQLLRVWPESADRHTVISLVADGGLADEIRGMEIEVTELAMRPGRPYPGELRKLGRLIDGLRPDLIQTWLYHADLIGGVAGRLASKAPVVWGIHHSLKARRTLKPSTLAVVRLNALFSRIIPARIVCCSHTALETHASIGFDREKMINIPNGVDITGFSPDPAARRAVRDELCLPADARLIGMFARYHPQKDHRNLIAAAGLLHRKMPGVHFVLSGQDIGEDNKLLGEGIVREGLAQNVHLLGLRSDMPQLHAAMDVFTLASAEGEALPLVLCEAMASGVPCVATDVGDAADVIGDTGRCVPARDPRALADAWQELLELPAATYGDLSARARRRVEEHYELGTITGAYRDLYRSLA